MNSTAKVARWTAVGVSAIWAAVLFVTGLDLNDNARRGLSYLPSAVGILVVAFDLWLWKLPGVSRITGRPRIWGTWKVELQPSTEARIPEGGDRGPIPGVMVVEQTFWTTAVQFYTRESGSSSTYAAFVNKTDAKQAKSLLFTYTNTARQAHAHRSYQHSGTCRLDVTGPSPNSLSGTYWTDRITAGDVILTLVDRKDDRLATTHSMPRGSSERSGCFTGRWLASDGAALKRRRRGTARSCRVRRIRPAEDPAPVAPRAHPAPRRSASPSHPRVHAVLATPDRPCEGDDVDAFL